MPKRTDAEDTDKHDATTRAAPPSHVSRQSQYSAPPGEAKFRSVQIPVSQLDSVSDSGPEQHGKPTLIPAPPNYPPKRASLARIPTKNESTIAELATQWTQQQPPPHLSFLPLSPFSRIVVGLTSFQVLSNLVKLFCIRSIHAVYLLQSRSSCSVELMTFEGIELHCSVSQMPAENNNEPPQFLVEVLNRNSDADGSLLLKTVHDILDGAGGTLNVGRLQDEERSKEYYQGLVRVEGIQQGIKAKPDMHDSLIRSAHKRMSSPIVQVESHIGELIAMGACCVGLEIMAFGLDPDKVGVAQSIVNSMAVLGAGSLSDTQGTQPDEELVRARQDIRDLVVDVIQKHKLPSCFFQAEEKMVTMEVDKDDEDYFCHHLEGPSPQHKRSLGRLIHLAYLVLASALHVNSVVAPSVQKGESTAGIVVEGYLDQCLRVSDTNMLLTLLRELRKNEPSSPHAKCRAAMSLRYIGMASKRALDEIRKMGGKRCVESARDLGRTSHAKLEWQCNQLICLFEE